MPKVGRCPVVQPCIANERIIVRISCHCHFQNGAYWLQIWRTTGDDVEELIFWEDLHPRFREMHVFIWSRRTKTQTSLFIGFQLMRPSVNVCRHLCYPLRSCPAFNCSAYCIKYLPIAWNWYPFHLEVCAKREIKLKYDLRKEKWRGIGLPMPRSQCERIHLQNNSHSSNIYLHSSKTKSAENKTFWYKVLNY